MPRYPRLFLAGVPLHIVQRGHNRQPVFIEDHDYQYYLTNLKTAKEALRIRVLAYCLMTNHVHLVVVPVEQPEAISKLMRVVAARQTRYVNKLERRSGTLWEGRFKASLIETDRYLLACCRYVDLNPVRAGMTTTPAEYSWSGFLGRIGLGADPILDQHDIFIGLGRSPKERAVAYQRFVAQGTDYDEITLIRQSLQRNQLTGSRRFQAEIETRIGRRISTNGPGRPKETARK